MVRFLPKKRVQCWDAGEKLALGYDNGVVKLFPPSGKRLARSDPGTQEVSIILTPYTKALFMAAPSKIDGVTLADRYILYRILSDVSEDPHSWGEVEATLLKELIRKMSSNTPSVPPEASVVSDILRRMEAEVSSEEERLLKEVKALWESDERFGFYDKS